MDPGKSESTPMGTEEPSTSCPESISSDEWDDIYRAIISQGIKPGAEVFEYKGRFVPLCWVPRPLVPITASSSTIEEAEDFPSRTPKFTVEETESSTQSSTQVNVSKSNSDNHSPADASSSVGSAPSNPRTDPAECNSIEESSHVAPDLDLAVLELGGGSDNELDELWLQKWVEEEDVPEDNDGHEVAALEIKSSNKNLLDELGEWLLLKKQDREKDALEDNGAHQVTVLESEGGNENVLHESLELSPQERAGEESAPQDNKGHHVTILKLEGDNNNSLKKLLELSLQERAEEENVPEDNEGHQVTVLEPERDTKNVLEELEELLLQKRAARENVPGDNGDHQVTVLKLGGGNNNVLEELEELSLQKKAEEKNVQEDNGGHRVTIEGRPTHEPEPAAGKKPEVQCGTQPQTTTMTGASTECGTAERCCDAETTGSTSSTKISRPKATLVIDEWMKHRRQLIKVEKMKRILLRGVPPGYICKPIPRAESDLQYWHEIRAAIIKENVPQLAESFVYKGRVVPLAWQVMSLSDAVKERKIQARMNRDQSTATSKEEPLTVEPSTSMADPLTSGAVTSTHDAEEEVKEEEVEKEVVEEEEVKEANVECSRGGSGSKKKRKPKNKRKRK